MKKSLYEYFCQLDLDGSGYLERDEIESLAEMFFGDCSEAAQKYVDEVFESSKVSIPKESEDDSGDEAAGLNYDGAKSFMRRISIFMNEDGEVSEDDKAKFHALREKEKELEALREQEMKATDHNAKLSDESLSNESASFDNIDIEAKHCNNLTADNITSELNPASALKGPNGELLAPDGKPIIGSDGKPVKLPAGAKLGADGKPVTGQGGCILGEDGKPLLGENGCLLGADGKPLVGDGGCLLSADGKPMLSKGGCMLTADGKPMTGENGCLLGADGKPLLGEGGCLLSADGKPLLGKGGCLLTADGKPLTGANGCLLGADGKPVVGENGCLLSADGTPLNSTNGKPLASSTGSSNGNGSLKFVDKNDNTNIISVSNNEVQPLEAKGVTAGGNQKNGPLKGILKDSSANKMDEMNKNKSDVTSDSHISNKESRANKNGENPKLEPEKLLGSESDRPDGKTIIRPGEQSIKGNESTAEVRSQNDNNKTLITVMDKDGKPVQIPAGAKLGADGKPVLGEGGCMLGADGKPLVGENGCLLGADGKPLLGEGGCLLSADGKPLLGPNGEMKGADGKPLIGEDGKPLVISSRSKRGKATPGSDEEMIDDRKPRDKRAMVTRTVYKDEVIGSNESSAADEKSSLATNETKPVKAAGSIWAKDESGKWVRDLHVKKWVFEGLKDTVSIKAKTKNTKWKYDSNRKQA